MSCRATRRLLPLYVGRDLPPARRRRIEAHLTGCPACREELVRYERSRQSLFALKTTPDLPADLWPAIRSRLGAAPRPALRRTGRAFAAAAMLMLTLGVGWSLLRAPDPDALPPGAPAAESTAPAPPAVFPAGGSFALSKVSPVMPARSENWEAFPSVSPVGDDVTGTWDEF